MKTVECNICNKNEIALNETIKIDDLNYCSICFDSSFLDRKDLENKKIEKNYDPTVCSNCNNDFGELELKKIYNHPICNDCEILIKNKTFPNWVKAFLIGILAIVIFSFIWNWKYYYAYKNVKKSYSYFENGDYFNASSLMRAASNKLPEVEDLETFSTYFNGIDLLSKDKCADALIQFNLCKSKIPVDMNINTLITQARIGAAFDKKDYKGFLDASLENLELDSVSAVSLTSVASAYACIFAEKGKLKDKENSIKYLLKAKQIDSTSIEMKEYYNMVDYRLFSKKIIKREDFKTQFPNGWIKN